VFGYECCWPAPERLPRSQLRSTRRRPCLSYRRASWRIYKPIRNSVSFSVTVSDALDPSPLVICSPSSGSIFPDGNTRHNACAATDRAGNSPAELRVTVKFTTSRIWIGLANSDVGIRFDLRRGLSEPTELVAAGELGASPAAADSATRISIR
jgi:hypothetical protein